MIDLKEKEEVIEVIKKSLFVLAGPLIKTLIFSLLPIYLLFFVDNQILNIASFVLIVVIVSYFFYHILNWYFDSYVITTQRIVEIANHGIFSKQITEMPLDRIDNSKSKIKGIFSTIFGYGNVVVYSISKANIELECIPEPRRIQNLISEVKENFLK